MFYDRKSKEVYISKKEIWSFLGGKFDLTYPVVQGVTKKWLGEVYNLRRVTTHADEYEVEFDDGRGDI